MVLHKRLDYGFNGYEVPATPRAARSPRKSAFKKKSQSSFDLLAAVAGKLLLEGGNSSSSSNNASGNEDHLGDVVKRESVYGEERVREESCDHENAERRFFVSEILPKSCELQERSPSPPKDFHFGSTSVITSDSSDKFRPQGLEGTKIEDGSLGSVYKKPVFRNPLVCSDDDENFSARTNVSCSTKSFRSNLCNGDRRIRKILASKYSKVLPKVKDTKVMTSGDLKPDYYSKKHCLRSLKSDRNYPIKKRRYFDHYTEPKSEETVKNEDLSGSPHKVKVGIKSFKVPELFIEIPETATVGSLKRAVLEAVTTILGGGLRVGVLVNGKKVRDDNKMLLQSGISLDTLSDTLGFCLEPNPQQSTKPYSPEDSNFIRSCNVPQTLTRRVLSPWKHTSPKPSHSVESDLDSKPSASNTMISRANAVYSRALVPVPAFHAQAISIVPPRKTKRSEVVQRRIRRPFSVAEVEALVQAVERLGTGRWRDVKLRAFDNAKHRTYVDLKDKWKTLVHTARISPQQRRGEPVPQELLDRVLTAHAYWSQQQGKHQLLLQEGPLKIETSLGL